MILIIPEPRSEKKVAEKTPARYGPYEGVNVEQRARMVMDAVVCLIRTTK